MPVPNGSLSAELIMNGLDQQKRCFLTAMGCVLALLSLLYSAATPAVRVEPFIQGGVWERDFDYILPLTNPFDTAELALIVTFTSPSDEKRVITGFHVGDGVGGQVGIVWRARFVPDETGFWTYTYKWVYGTIQESDETDDETVFGNGALLVVLDYAAQLEKVQADESSSTATTDATSLADPLIHVPFYVALENYLKVDDPRMGTLLDYVKDSLGANGVAIILKNRVWNFCQTTSYCSPAFDLLDIANWDRLDRFMQMLEDRELAANIMFYGNDDEAPGFKGESTTETILLQYAVSRLSHYEGVSFDSGINILEYRDSDWSQFFADRISDLDLNDRPVSSRQSDGFTPFSCADCTYDSLGDKNPDFDTILAAISGSTKPIFYTDRWRVGFTDGLFDVDGIRKSMWNTTIAGGAGFILGGRNGALRLDDFVEDLQSIEQYKVFSDFWNNEDRNANEYVDCNGKVDIGHCFGKVDLEYVIYIEQDDGTIVDRDEITVDLSDWTMLADMSWMNPKTGVISGESTIDVGNEVTLTVPTDDDWVLVIKAPQLPETKTLITRVVGAIYGRVNGTIVYGFPGSGDTKIIPRVIGVINY